MKDIMFVVTIIVAGAMGLLFMLLIDMWKDRKKTGIHGVPKRKWDAPCKQCNDKGILAQRVGEIVMCACFKSNNSVYNQTRLNVYRELAKHRDCIVCGKLSLYHLLDGRRYCEEHYKPETNKFSII